MMPTSPPLSLGLASVFVTGGAGFIGSALVRQLIAETVAHVVTIDKLTYAGNLQSLAEARTHPRHTFVQADICDAKTIRTLFEVHRPSVVYHLAAESHVDRSIDGPGEFIQSNVVGTFHLLQESLRYWRTLDDAARTAFRFVHVSTDEVFGSLGATGLFTERTPYDPSSPYSAS
jgi:dTDP-glucose 4,6-dehydratase